MAAPSRRGQAGADRQPQGRKKNKRSGRGPRAMLTPSFFSILVALFVGLLVILVVIGA
jgi:hypothetical protein